MDIIKISADQRRSVATRLFVVKKHNNKAKKEFTELNPLQTDENTTFDYNY